MTPGMPASPSPHSLQAEARTTPAHLAEATAPNLWRRMACWLYEGMLMFGVVFIAGYLFGTLSQTRNAMDNRHALQAFLFVVFGIYFTWFWAKGQTLAQKTWHIRVVGQDGQPITQGSLVGPNDRGFLAAALGPGMRAVTVPVSTTSGVAGFVFPGDRVDVILTQEVTGGGDGPALKVSETIVRNLRVLATDQRIDSKDEEGKTVVKTFSMVTVEATPRLAEKVAVAQSLGTLSLSLRSIADNTAELERAVASGEVKLPAGDMILYPASSLHRVTPITRGVRLAAIFWVQSMVRDDGERSLLFDLDMAIGQVSEAAPGSPGIVALTSCYHNLLRRWSDT